MRILVLISNMSGGGAERVAALLCNQWSRAGHSVVLTPTFLGPKESVYPLDPAVEVLHLVDRAGSGWRRGRLGRLVSLRTLVQDVAPDVVVSFLYNVNVSVLMATIGMKVPVVVAECSYPPNEPTPSMLGRLRRWAYPRASRTVMQTERGLQWLRSEIPAARGTVLINGIELPIPASPPAVNPDTVVRQGAKLLLGVGRLDALKNFALLIESFARLADRHPQWTLAILGSGVERENLERQVETLGMSGRIHIVGRAGNLHDWYARADAFATTSLLEGFPNSLLEALCYGLPAAALDCPTGPAELIRDGVNGVLLPLNSDAGHYAAGLERVLEPDMPQLEVERDALRAKCAIETVARQWVALFESVQTGAVRGPQG
ncbi:glycosyltransferase [Sphingomonas sp.]|uniref:glycosyltransferase n=1 Tax=Sphingomonas sp. TaxID=28214 RepID=UPI002DD63EA1|nr:glycosyltransferase [Sphingomonas sp.]